MSSAQILIAVTETAVFFKILGRANFNLSAHFKSAIAELQSRGHRRFVLDLSECESMDSTFLGTLSAWAIQLESESGREGVLPIELWNPNERITSLLDDLGVKHLFRICAPERIGIDFQAAPTGPVSREILSQTSLEAHQTLMAVDPANIPRFKDVVAFLREDLARLKSPAGGTGLRETS
ncbi:MAG TPA: STAS domain-containing protein [Candidatus Paceibacterota bacterium]|nr:STAS domain-containing protein [Candidatus Paceibacterota bacterium]